MRSKFKWIFALLVALTMQFSFAQEKTITGVVSDATGSLPGANVVVKGTTRGTQTDLDGKYSIQAKKGETLVYSFVGMTEMEMKVGDKTTMDVKLTGLVLETVVVDGYKSTVKRKSSVASTTVTAEAVEGRPNVSFLQSLQSQVAGLNIATASGTPGSAKIDVVLRGYGSVNGNPDPLYVIDNVPSNSVVFRGLNAEDIESITVLKDAGATAIYGNRGANGVIVITTKKGKFNSKLSVRYNGSTGYAVLQQNRYNLLNAKQELTLEKERGAGFASEMGLTDADIAAWNIDTNWADVFFRTGETKSHNLSFTSGSENMSNFTSISYFDQDGIVPTTYFKRFTFRSNFNGKSTNNKFTYFTNFTGSYSKRSQLQQETTSSLNANVVQNPLQGSIASMPWISPDEYVNGQQVYDVFSSTDPGHSQREVPLSLLDYINPGVVPNEYNEIKLILNASGTYKFNDYLSFSSTAGLDFNESRRLFARAPWSFLGIAVAQQGKLTYNGIDGVHDAGETVEGTDIAGLEQQSTSRDFGFNLTNRLNYNRTFNEKHTIDISLFTEYNKYHAVTESFQHTGLDYHNWSFGSGNGYYQQTVISLPNNIPSTGDNQQSIYNGIGATTTEDLIFNATTAGASKATAGLFSYFATADYDYDSKYGISATIRRDASYKFIDDNRWGTFWSVSGRWNIDAEKFMQGSVFNALKLRASYGTTGNQNVETVAYGANPIYASASLTRDLTAPNITYDEITSGFILGQIANPDLKWETTTQADLGVDFIFKKRLSGTIDVYRKTTTDLFNDFYTSAVTSIFSIPANTNAKLLNTGIELSLKYDVFKKGPFKMDVYFNASYNKNEWKDLVYPLGEDNVFQGNVAQQNGRPLNAFYLVPYVGVNQENGNLLFLAADGSLTESPGDEDRRFIDKNFVPAYQGGFGLNASYEGFFVNSDFSFVADVARFDFDLANMSAPEIIGSYPVTTDFLNAWTADHHTNYPSLDATNTTFDGNSDRFLRDASYIRMKNLVVGYDVPKKFLDKTFLTNVKIYTQMENYLTWSKWRGFDVENLNASNQGGYPAPKVFSVGVDVQF